MEVKIEASWKTALQTEFEQPYFQLLTQYIKQEYATQTVYPAGKNLFAAFDACPLNQVKVVILGQDPYHGPNQAHGLSFSVADGVAIPPSLVNIYTEIEKELGKKPPQSGNLMRWAAQGVLLLNTVLTVRAHEPQSHRGRGWEQFTDAAIKVLNSQTTPIVFMLWGSPAQTKSALLNNPNHLVLKAPHPSPLSAYRGFMGCGHFLKANEFLKSKGIPEINW